MYIAPGLGLDGQLVRPEKAVLHQPILFVLLRDVFCGDLCLHISLFSTGNKESCIDVDPDGSTLYIRYNNNGQELLKKDGEVQSGRVRIYGPGGM